MRFRDLYPLREGAFSTLMVTIQDYLLLSIARGEKEINTEKFKNQLRDAGFNLSVEQIIKAVDQSNLASSVDAEKIVPVSELPDDIAAASPEDPAEKVSDLAASQAKKNIK